MAQAHLDTFAAVVDTGIGGAGLPTFVIDEFDAFLACGILAHGVLRLSCDGCAQEKLVAFSCKRQDICPSCGRRRMAEAAAHPVDQVIPKMPAHPWVLSFAIPLRSLFAVHPKLHAPVLQIIHSATVRGMKTAGLQWMDTCLTARAPSDTFRIREKGGLKFLYSTIATVSTIHLFKEFVNDSSSGLFGPNQGVLATRVLVVPAHEGVPDQTGN